MTTRPSAWCRVFWARPTAVREWHLRLLSDSELRRRDCYLRQIDVDRFTTAAALLRIVAGDLLDTPPDRVVVQRTCLDCSRPHGRPVIPGAGVHVSITHSGQRVGVALTPVGPVGIDVEVVADRDGDALPLRLVLNAEELPAFQASGSDRTVAFLRTWTRKEAVLKATGDGLRVPMTALVVSGHDQPARLMSCAFAPQLVAQLQLHDLDVGPADTAALAVVYQGSLSIEERDGAPALS